jgi:hypothetical protein
VTSATAVAAGLPGGTVCVGGSSSWRGGLVGSSSGAGIGVVLVSVI